MGGLEANPPSKFIYPRSNTSKILDFDFCICAFCLLQLTIGIVGLLLFDRKTCLIYNGEASSFSHIGQKVGLKNDILSLFQARESNRLKMKIISLDEMDTRRVSP